MITTYGRNPSLLDSLHRKLQPHEMIYSIISE